MACMTAAADGTRISIDDPEAAAFRASVIEWLMTNHPHDCPVCEEGGECHLQDMTLMSGHVYRRYRFHKRTHRNQYLGPFVKHEMNRCIACYRCVRFYREYAGGRDLDVFGAHNHVYFGRHADGVLESEFSGNLVEVCPTGVFTDKTLSAVYTRKWDMPSAPSVCVHCGVGCNTFPNARYGQMRRVINRYHHEINGYFLCDRGRYGHGFIGQAARVRAPLRTHADGDGLQPLGRADAIAQLAGFLRARAGGADRAPDGTVFGIGSPRASLEANFALRALVGPAHFYQGVADAEARSLAIVLQILRQAPAPIATLRDAEQADAALVLGEDLPDTAPRLALALRQMVRHAAFALAARRQIPAWQDASVRDIGHDARSALFIASSDATRLDDVAIPLRAAPPDIVRLGCAVLHALDPSAPAPADLAPAQQQQAEHIAHTLQGAQRPLIIAGVSAGCDALLHTAAAIAGALKRAGRAARMLLTVPECNSLGLALLGGAPLSAALARTAAMAARAGPAATLLVLENDLYRRATRDSVEAALRCARHLVVLDHTLHATARRAELLLPAATFAESSGTLINYEGRAQRFFQLLFPEDELTASWRWLNQAACALDPHAPHWDGLDQVIAAIVTELPALAAIRAAAPDAALRVAGSRVASAPPRESGRTAMYADRSVHEPPPPPNPDAPYTESMEGYYGQMPAALYPFFWSPAWNS
ncbi:MAG: NADH-quinone oxidoreductase subunit NuoG, partial [Steroidobacteraceae bacterium]